MKKDQQELQTWHVILIIGVVMTALVMSIVNRFLVESTDIPVPDEAAIILNEQTCQASGGTWNACGSACRGEEGACIQVCVEQCECASTDECPFGTVCSDMINGTGICSKRS